METIKLHVLLPKNMSQADKCHMFMQLERVLGAYDAYGIVI